ncbi:hypothetical protein MIND_01042900 [Mycena indigotica]|uniref:rRNA-processing protein FYV7 n=1 Tax=Mycena indigotica TaxID=2126181 RepID=A0A8H6SB26_9AGAR|nr:uncharacterized protein MIND_01042900 [Mycena indigotica]KAF7295047.1 hypothetical protein MIND_01042900 [Mycena indigotica]
MPEKRKRPPTFQHHPANRAKKLKQTWVQNAKLKQKWRTEKRRIGKETEPEIEEDDMKQAVEVRRNAAPSPTPPPTKKTYLPPKTPVQQQERSSLRDRARDAYSRSSLHTYKSDPSGKRQRGGNTGRGQPDMKKRMSVLLETIKRDFS